MNRDFIPDDLDARILALISGQDQPARLHNNPSDLLSDKDGLRELQDYENKRKRLQREWEKRERHGAGQTEGEQS